jgi:hypothetical protein
MKKITKERMQQIWDHELISAWDEKGKNKMWMVIKKFICRVYPEKEAGYFDAGFANIVDLLSSMGIKRCLDSNHVTGIDATYCWNTDVIGFIHGRCEGMSMDLINGIDKPLVLLGINDYRWIKRDLNGNRKVTSKKRRQKLKATALLKVKARSLDGSNWNTVN